MEDPRVTAREDAHRNALKLRLVREIVAANFEAALHARRDQSPLRRRYLDETMVTTSTLALAAGMS